MAVGQWDAGSEELKVEFYEASSLLLDGWALKCALSKSIIVRILQGVISSISINRVIMILNSAQMPRSNLNAAIKFIRLYSFEVTFLIIFIELRFEIDFSIQQTFHSSRLLDVHGTIRVAWQSDVIHLVF